jgi:nucleotide-binding universal stress UspA family protein
MAPDIRISKVLVGADGSPGARVAVRWATDLVRRCDAELVLVHARGLLERAQELLPHADELPGWLQQLIDDVDPEIGLSVTVVDGPAPEALLRAAENLGADLIVVGRRGGGSPFELALGSTSREVSSRALVPVLVVPAD